MAQTRGRQLPIGVLVRVDARVGRLVELDRGLPVLTFDGLPEADTLAGHGGGGLEAGGKPAAPTAVSSWASTANSSPPIR